MDFIIYTDKLRGTAAFPTVTASTGSPKTLYHAPQDLVYVNTGSGWQPMIQPGNRSIYSAFSSASAATQANIVASVSDTSSAPHGAHKSVAAATADIAVRGK